MGENSPLFARPRIWTASTTTRLVSPRAADHQDGTAPIDVEPMDSKYSPDTHPTADVPAQRLPSGASWRAPNTRDGLPAASALSSATISAPPCCKVDCAACDVRAAEAHGCPLFAANADESMHPTDVLAIVVATADPWSDPGVVTTAQSEIAGAVHFEAAIPGLADRRGRVSLRDPISRIGVDLRLGHPPAGSAGHPACRGDLCLCTAKEPGDRRDLLDLQVGVGFAKQQVHPAVSGPRNDFGGLPSS